MMLGGALSPLVRTSLLVVRPADVDLCVDCTLQGFVVVLPKSIVLCRRVHIISHVWLDLL